MSGQTIKLSASEGGAFDCYLALPEGGGGKGPAVVLMSSIFGVDADLRKNADDLAAEFERFLRQHDDD